MSTDEIHVRPLDLILFRGSDFVSSSIRYLQLKHSGVGADEYSHVGIIISREVLDLPELEPNELYIWESTMSGNIADGVKNIHNESWFGSQIRKLSDVLHANAQNEDSIVAVAPVDWQRFNVDESAIRKHMSELWSNYGNKRYELNAITMAASIWPIFRPLRNCLRFVIKDTEWVFCSELCCRIYAQLGLVSNDIDPENTVPCDFWCEDLDGMKSPCVEPIVILCDGKEKNYVSCFSLP